MHNPIIAIGALGGSGTRAFAQILQEAGLFIGDELNESLDNLLFTRLFKDPKWHDRVSERGINRRLQIFIKIMQGEGLNTFESLMLRNALRHNSTYPTGKEELKKYSFSYLKKSATTQHKRWGWKEPNTQIFVESLLTSMPKLVYIHVLRHGLDMAFSSNTRQLQNWGHLYGIALTGTESENEVAQKQLDYWIASTKRIVALQEKFPKRIHLFKLEELCAKPTDTINLLLKISRLKTNKDIGENLAKIPVLPASSNRYKSKDLGCFSKGQLDFVASMGYAIE